MILTKSEIYKLLLTILTLWCLTPLVSTGKLTKAQAIFNDTEITANNKAAVAAKKVAENISYHEEENTANEVSENARKNAVLPASDTALSVWSIVSGLWKWVKEDINESLFGDNGKTTTSAEEGRTFGKIRRLQMALIPIVFKFGVLSAMITFLVAVAVKTFFLVKVLVLLNLVALLAKFFTLKGNSGHFEHFSAPPAPAWNPYMNSGWHSITEEQPHMNKEIHLHIHGSQLHPQVSSGFPYGSDATGQTHGWEKRNDPYGGYDTIALQGQQNELSSNELPKGANSVAGSRQPSGNFLGNHRMF